MASDQFVILGYAVSGVVALSVVAIFVSVFINFLESDGKARKKRQKRSIVATGSMTAFFVVYYLVVRFSISALVLPLQVMVVLVPTGLFLVVFGCVTNIRGRFFLGRNWANQVTVYDDQTLVRKGPFAWVRHPLYASLIWMFIGGSLVYANPLALILALGVFWPFMQYRALQEEKLLLKRFKEYAKYRQEVNMFFPWVMGR